MPTGTRTVQRPKEEFVDRLRMMLGASNCEVTDSGPDRITFEHGTYLTQSASLIPKTCRLEFRETADGTQVTYDVTPATFARIWLLFWGIVLCWMIFPPILAYRVLVVHPRRFVENLLDGAEAM